MERLILCNIPFTSRKDKHVYKNEDPSIPTTEDEVMFPINDFLGALLKPEDNVKAVLIAKQGMKDFYEQNVNVCREELAEISRKTGASIDVSVIYTPFKEDRKTHNKLLMDIIDSIPLGSRISVDMTYGPKDLVIVLFTALRFAARYMDCQIDNIMYGQSDFDENGKPVNTRLCEMSPLYYLESIISNVRCDDPDKAKDLLRTLINR